MATSALNEGHRHPGRRPRWGAIAGDVATKAAAVHIALSDRFGGAWSSHGDVASVEAVRAVDGRSEEVLEFSSQHHTLLTSADAGGAAVQSVRVLVAAAKTSRPERSGPWQLLRAANVPPVADTGDGQVAIEFSRDLTPLTL